jgi:hypothetical protein
MNTNISAELARVRWHLAALRFEHAMLRHARALRSKYDPNQPRVPAGNSDGGQWTWGSGGVRVSIFQDPAESSPSGFVLSDAAPDPLIEGAQYAQSRTTIDYSNLLTGLPTIDNTTKELTRTLARTMEAMNFIPTWTPQAYGTAVHVAFGIQVRLQGLPGIGPNDVEHSFVEGRSADHYGQAASIRTDVVLRDSNGDVIAIYDVKTGGAKLTDARVRELRAKTGVSSNVPIIELHFERGATLKSHEGSVRSVIARLWNPLRQDSLEREVGQ